MLIILFSPTSKDRLLIGSLNNEVNLFVRVRNNNESAYLSKMTVDYDANFRFLAVDILGVRNLSIFFVLNFPCNLLYKFSIKIISLSFENRILT